MSLVSAPLEADAIRFDFALDDLSRAAEIVGKVLSPTPQISWPLLSQRTGAEVWVKHENHLPTGAFKVRGGVLLADSLGRGRLGPTPKGTITASVRPFAGRGGLEIAYEAGARLFHLIDARRPRRT